MNYNLIKSLYGHIDSRRRWQFNGLLLITVLASFSEVVSLGAVVPFIAVITNPEKIFSYPFMADLGQVIGITTAENMVGPISLFFVVLALLTGLLRIIVLRISISLSYATGADLSSTMYKRTLYQPYSTHINRSSSDVISGITQKVATATSGINSIIAVITNLCLFVAIFVALILIDPVTATLALLIFGLIYVVISLSSKSILYNNAVIIALQQSNLVRVSQEGLGAIRDILIGNSQEYYSRGYRNRVHELQRATGTNSFITLAPRYVMESLALVLIGLFTFFISSDNITISNAIPTLGALALGAQRLLPILQQLYGNYSAVVGSQQSLKDIIVLLDQKMPDINDDHPSSPFNFVKYIKFDQVSFGYSSDGPLVLKNLSFKIIKGSKVGFIGETGSGKSTAIDVVLGLLQPTDGNLIVDELVITQGNQGEWQNLLSHVPQHIYLADASIAENIAFGVPYKDIDHQKVLKAGYQAQMEQFVGKLPDGYGTLVGERGVKFSGGQRQRIGIARALYKNASVLVLDEATSALDGKIENLVMREISALDSNLTVIIIAHRIATLEHCDKIFEFSSNGGFKIVKYQDLINRDNGLSR
jgi:ATP-binding cassette, subfamily B, bacterial PglK